MTRAWVIGRGLLGTAIEAALKAKQIDVHTSAFSWTKPELLKGEFEKAIDACKDTGSWQIYWCAGQGTMQSSTEAMVQETEALKTFLQCLTGKLAHGKLMFASSAGAIYANSPDEVINETSAPTPLTPYGTEKLKQEELLKAWSIETKTPVLIARLSTLYGTGQSHGKKQGLLTHIARSMLQRKPIHIFVPLDTMRDYLHVQDAATSIVESMADLTTTTMKIVASQEPTTIAEIIGIFRHITRTNPKIVTSIGTTKNAYPHRVRFRSQSPQHAHKTNLATGIAEILAHERLVLAKGILN